MLLCLEPFPRTPGTEVQFRFPVVGHMCLFRPLPTPRSSLPTPLPSWTGLPVWGTHRAPQGLCTGGSFCLGCAPSPSLPGGSFSAFWIMLSVPSPWWSPPWIRSGTLLPTSKQLSHVPVLFFSLHTLLADTVRLMCPLVCVCIPHWHAGSGRASSCLSIHCCITVSCTQCVLRFPVVQTNE